MIEPIQDLTPFFEDGCWTVVFLAREASLGVVLRYGPADWWRLTLWNTENDVFEDGQWFRGRIDPMRCDLSPNGELFLYFAEKFRHRNAIKGYGGSWSAVSRPPYFTALALWPHGGFYDGFFMDNLTIRTGLGTPRHHPDHPPGPLQLVEGFDPIPVLAWSHGWQRPPKPHGPLLPGIPPVHGEFRKPFGDLILGRDAFSVDWFRPWRKRELYSLYRANGEPILQFEAQWADWDQRGRLVAAVGGRILAGTLEEDKTLVWRQLAAMHEEQPAQMETPAWAQRW
jgi:hypothetical protein